MFQKQLTPKQVRYAIYSSIALVVAGVVYPWFFTPGYLFLLDFTLTKTPPLIPWSQVFTISGWLPEQLLWLVARILPAPLVQKIYLAGIIALSGISAATLVYRSVLKNNTNIATYSAALVSGLFYALNPFVIGRIYMGQHLLLLGYAITPWAIHAWLRFLVRPTYTRAALAAGVAVAVVLTSSHHIILLGVALLILTPYRTLKDIPWRIHMAYLLPLLAVASLLLFHRTYISDTPLSLSRLGPQVFALQAPVSGNAITDSVLLAASWRASINQLTPFAILPSYLGAMIFFLGLVVTGGFLAYRRHYHLGVRACLLLAVALLAAMSVSHPLTAPSANWMYDHIPFWIGMRESGKFLGLIALAETILLAYGVFFMFQKANTHTVRILQTVGIGALLVSLGIFLLPTLRGFSHQIVLGHYPPAWHEWNTALAAHSTPPQMLFLPWHQYIPLSFTQGQTIANPAPMFFTNAQVLAGDNIEIYGPNGSPFIYSESTRPISKQIENDFLQDKNIQVLTEEQILYVVLVTDNPDSHEYDWLFNQDDLSVVLAKEGLVVFKNERLTQ